MEVIGFLFLIIGGAIFLAVGESLFRRLELRRYKYIWVLMRHRLNDRERAPIYRIRKIKQRGQRYLVELTNGKQIDVSITEAILLSERSVIDEAGE